LFFTFSPAGSGFQQAIYYFPLGGVEK